MRDLILLAALIGIIPLILRTPVVGLLAWIWISLTNPQREVYGFLNDFQLNLVVAAITAIAWLASSERKTAPVNPFTVLLTMFALWGCLATYLALDRAYSMPLLERTLKTCVLAFAIMALATNKARTQAVVWAFVISLGYYAVKGGGFVLLTAGGQRVYGPEDSMIADNNALGLALVVLLPLIDYLRRTSREKAVRLACLGGIALTIVAILGTYSRGALVALGVAAIVYGFRSRFGALLLIPAAALAVMAPSLLPAGWSDRMSTIQSYDQDASFEGRRAAWKTSANIAAARPLTGGGFAAVELTPVAQQFQSPGSLKAGRAAHSIYFQVLGDTGFVGLALYLLLLLTSGINTVLVINEARGREDLAWADLLARMLQVSIAAFLVGGAALSMAYYDGFIVMLTLSTVLLRVVRNQESVAVESRLKPRWADNRVKTPNNPASAPNAGHNVL